MVRVGWLMGAIATLLATVLAFGLRLDSCASSTGSELECAGAGDISPGRVALVLVGLALATWCFTRAFRRPAPQADAVRDEAL